MGTLTSNMTNIIVGRVPKSSSKPQPSNIVPKMTSRIKQPTCPTTPATKP